MSLRVRLTLVVAATVALVVVGAVYAAHVSASRQLRSATDEFLQQRADRFAHVPSNGIDDDGGDFRGGSHGGPPLADPDAITQILASDGTIAALATDAPRRGRPRHVAGSLDGCPGVAPSRSAWRLRP